MLDRLRHPGIAVLIAGFLVIFGAGGQRQIFGVFVRPLEADFSGDRAQIAVVAGLSLLLFGLGQPIAGRLIDTRGPGLTIPLALALVGLGSAASALAAQVWQFGLLYGVVAGAGLAGTTSAPVGAAIAPYFSRRRGLAFGLVAAGAPLGQFVLAPTAAGLIAAYGWRPTMAAAGGALLALAPFVWLMLRREGVRTTRAASGPSLIAAARSRPFVLLAVSNALCGFMAPGLVHTHLVAYSADLHLPETQGAQVLGLVGLFNVAGLLVGGHIADRFGSRVPLATVFAVRSLAFLWVARAGGLDDLLVFALVFGLSDMAVIPLFGTALVEHFGTGSLGALYGTIMVTHQIGSAAGAAAGGLIYIYLGGYPPAYLLAALFAVVAAFTAFSLPRPQPAPRAARAGV